MNHKSVHDDYFLSFCEYAIASLLLLDCNTIYIVKVNVNVSTYVNYTVCFVIFLLSVTIAYKTAFMRNFDARVILLILSIEIYNSVFLLVGVSADYERQYVFRFIVFFSGMLLYFYCARLLRRSGLIFEKISDIVIILACFSLFFWTFGTMIKAIQPSSYVAISWGPVHSVASYHGFYYETQFALLFNRMVIRNSGIFAEAPMFSLVLSIALLTELFVREKTKRIRITILIITVFTTFSTTGMIFCVAAIFCKYLISNPKGKVVRTLKLLLVPVVSFVTLFFVIYIFSNKTSSVSFLIRTDDFKAGYLAWKNNILFGNGYGSLSAIYQNMNAFRTIGKGYSNSVMLILAQGGIWLFLFYLVPFLYSLIRSMKLKDFKQLIVTTAVFILLIVTIFPYTYMMLAFLAFWWMQGEKISRASCPILKPPAKIFSSQL